MGVQGQSHGVLCTSPRRACRALSAHVSAPLCRRGPCSFVCCPNAESTSREGPEATWPLTGDLRVIRAVGAIVPRLACTHPAVAAQPRLVKRVWPMDRRQYSASGGRNCLQRMHLFTYASADASAFFVHVCSSPLRSTTQRARSIGLPPRVPAASLPQPAASVRPPRHRGPIRNLSESWRQNTLSARPPTRRACDAAVDAPAGRPPERETGLGSGPVVGRPKDRPKGRMARWHCRV